MSRIAINHRRTLPVLALAISAGGIFNFAAPKALGVTYLWTRGAANNNWDNKSNWLSGGVLAAPPQTPAAGSTTDILYAGTSAAFGSTSALRQPYTIDSLTFANDFNDGGVTFNVSSATLLTNAASADLTINAGGIFVGTVTFNTAIGTSTPGGALILGADQTWSVNNTFINGTSATTFTINRQITGNHMVTKTGAGLLVLGQGNNSNWAGGMTILAGSVRTGGLDSDPSGQFGTGPVNIVTDSDVIITASTVNSAGGARNFPNNLTIGGAGLLTFGGSFNLNFTPASTWTIASDKRLSISFTSDIPGAVTGPGGLTKLGGGMLIFDHSNSYAGATQIQDGVMRVNASSGLGSGSSSVTVGAASASHPYGGQLELNGGVVIAGKPLSIAGIGDTNAASPSGIEPLMGALRSRTGANAWTGPVSLSAAATIQADSGSSLTLSAGITNSAAGALRVQGAGTVNAASIRVAGAITLGSNSHVGIIANGAFSGASSADSVAFDDANATLDLTNNDLLIHAQSESAVRALVSNWYAGGARTGKGLISSTAGTGAGPDSLATLAVAPNLNRMGGALFDTFDDLPAVQTDILVKYTYFGDTDFNGIVDGSDVANYQVGLAGGLAGWTNGDFNYDGVVDAADGALLNNALNNQGAPFSSSGGGGSVPEASAIALLPGLALLSRRRRR